MYTTERNLQVIDFNTKDKPWRIHTTSILHDNNLIVESNYNINDNNLVIESKTSDINFSVQDSKKISFNGKTVFNAGISLLQESNIDFQDLCCNNITVDKDISINGDLYINSISMLDLNNKVTSLETSFNEIIFIMERLGISI